MVILTSHYTNLMTVISDNIKGQRKISYEHMKVRRQTGQVIKTKVNNIYLAGGLILCSMGQQVG